MMEYAVAWTEINAKWQMVVKRKEFKTEAAMHKFVEKLEQKNGFYRINAYSYPRKGN